MTNNNSGVRMKNKTPLSLLVKLGIASTVLAGTAIADPLPPLLEPVIDPEYHSADYKAIDQNGDGVLSLTEYVSFVDGQQATQLQSQFSKMYLYSKEDNTTSINVDEFVAKAPFSAEKNDDLFIAYSGEDALMDGKEYVAMRLQEELSGDVLWQFSSLDWDMDGSVSFSEWQGNIKPLPDGSSHVLTDAQKAQLKLIRSLVASKKKQARVQKVIQKLQATIEETESENKKERLSKKLQKKEAYAKRLADKISQLQSKLSNVPDSDIQAIINHQLEKLTDLETTLAQTKNKKEVRRLKRKITQTKQVVTEAENQLGSVPIKPPIDSGTYPYSAVTDTEIKVNLEKWEAFKKEYAAKGFNYTIREGKVVTSTIFKQNGVIIDASTTVYPQGTMPSQPLTIDSLFSQLKGKAVKFDKKYGYPVQVDWPIPKVHPPVEPVPSIDTPIMDEVMVVKPESPNGVQTYSISNFQMGIEGAGSTKLAELKQELSKILSSKEGYHYTLVRPMEWFMNEEPKPVVVNVKDNKVVSAFTLSEPPAAMNDLSTLSSIESLLDKAQKDIINHKLSVNLGSNGSGTGFKVSTYMQDRNLSDPAGSSYAIEKIGLMNIDIQKSEEVNIQHEE